MSTSRLKIYNGALIHCEQGLLNTSTGLSEDREARYLLDQWWNDGAIDTVLAMGQWKFATRVAQFTYSTTLTPAFGYARAFQKPDDWISTVGISASERFDGGPLDFEDEGGYWYADVDDLYVRYISNDSSYGADLSKWPSTFSDLMKAYLAKQIAASLTKDKQIRDKVKDIFKEAKNDARNSDAMAGPTRFPQAGSWNRARHRYGGRGPLGDGGTSGTFTS